MDMDLIDMQNTPGNTYTGTSRVGTCSLCGGDVYGHRGAWFGVVPPGPDTCVHCGAVAASWRSDVIEMQPRTRPSAAPKPLRVVIESPANQNRDSSGRYLGHLYAYALC